MSEETFGNWIKIMNKTLNYYNENAQSFASGTVSVEFTEMQDKFLHIYSILVAAQEGTRNIFWTKAIW